MLGKLLPGRSHRLGQRLGLWISASAEGFSFLWEYIQLQGLDNSPRPRPVDLDLLVSIPGKLHMGRGGRYHRPVHLGQEQSVERNGNRPTGWVHLGQQPERVGQLSP